MNKELKEFLKTLKEKENLDVEIKQEIQKHLDIDFKEEVEKVFYRELACSSWGITSAKEKREIFRTKDVIDIICYFKYYDEITNFFKEHFNELDKVIIFVNELIDEIEQSEIEIKKAKEEGEEDNEQ